MTAPLEPALTLDFVARRVADLRESDREARRHIEQQPTQERYHLHLAQTVSHLSRCDTLRSLVLHMMAWHAIDCGDLVLVAREVAKLNERLPTT